MGVSQHKLSIGYCSDRGLVRKANEDAYGYDEELGLFLVADGVGGSVAGERASRLAVQTILESAETDSVQAVDNPKRFLISSIQEAHQKIREDVAENPGLAGMATTMVAMLILDDYAAVAHIGDSRLYLYRRGNLIQKTVDHSLIQDMIKSGSIKADIAHTLPIRHVITRCIGMDEKVIPDAGDFYLQDGDRVLMCTDGLTEHISNNEIAEILADIEYDAKNACVELVGWALERGGKDNITIIIVDYERGA